MDKEINGKQRAFGAAVVIMSRIADQIVWHTGNPVTVEEVSLYLKKSKDIDDGDKTIELLKSWLASNNINVSRLNSGLDGNSAAVDETAKIYAMERTCDGQSYMVVLLDALSIFAKQYGYSDARAVARSVVEAGYAMRDEVRNTNYRRVSINGAKVKGLWVRWDDSDDAEKNEVTANTEKTEKAQKPAQNQQITESKPRIDTITEKAAPEDLKFRTEIAEAWEQVKDIIDDSGDLPF